MLLVPIFEIRLHSPRIRGAPTNGWVIAVPTCRRDLRWRFRGRRQGRHRLVLWFQFPCHCRHRYLRGGVLVPSDLCSVHKSVEQPLFARRRIGEHCFRHCCRSKAICPSSFQRCLAASDRCQQRQTATFARRLGGAGPRAVHISALLANLLNFSPVVGWCSFKCNLRGISASCCVGGRHTSRAAKRPETAAVVKMSASLDVASALPS